MITKFLCKSFPGALTGLQALSSLPHSSKPISYLQQDHNDPGKRTLAKKAPCSDMRAPVKPPRTRFVFTSHPCSLLDLRKLQQICGKDGQEQVQVGTAQEYLAWLRSRFDQVQIDQNSEKPTPMQEAGQVARSLTHLAGGYHHLLCHAGSVAVTGMERPESWATRDFDRSSLVFGDATAGFALQTGQMCEKYLALIKDRDAPVWGQVRSLLSEAVRQSAHLAQLSAQVKNGDIDRMQFARQIRELEKAGALRKIESQIDEALAALPDDAFTQTFRTFRLTGATGQVRLDGSTLNSNEGTDATSEGVLEELNRLHRLYPDTASIVIANFQDVHQVERLQARLKAYHLDHLSIVPLIEDEAAVAWFIQGGAKALGGLGVRRVMLAGSDLPREAGLTVATIRTAQFIEALLASGFDNFYFGTGCTPGRSGWGHSPSLAKSWAGHFSAFSQGQFTVQGAQHQILFGGDRIAADSLRNILQAMAEPQAPVNGEQIKEVETALDALIQSERAQRDPDGPFGQFFMRHKERFLGIRNAMAVCGSRDKTLSPHDYTNLFNDRAINVDFMQRFFRIVDGFAWTDLDAKTMAPVIERVREALAKGNPLMHQVLQKLALTSVDMYLSKDCQQIWQAAGFDPDEISKLERARRNRLDFLQACGYSLEEQPGLQRIVTEWLGVPYHGESSTAQNAEEIRRSVRSSATHAWLALRKSTPDRKQIVRGLSFIPYKSFSTSVKNKENDLP